MKCLILLMSLITFNAIGDGVDYGEDNNSVQNCITTCNQNGVNQQCITTCY